MSKLKNKNQAGIVLVLTVVFGGILATVLVSLTGYFIFQYKAGLQKVSWASALEIAEVGVNYYRWHLAHAPDDYQDGTGAAGPYVHTYSDPEAGEIGSFSLNIIPPEAGSTIVTIESTGWTNRHPKVTRTVKVRYGIPSVAQYSFLSDASSWYGGSITVNGRIHSNNGIRMDGTNLSTVNSHKETYMCGSETGCSPPQTKDGVWGAGGDSALWRFPVTKIDFDSITADLATVRQTAIDSGTRFTASGGFGYHTVFQSNGTVDVYRVTGTRTRRGYNNGSCMNLPERIWNQNYIGSYDLSSDNIFFFEDDVWVEGIVSGRATVVAAHYPFDSEDTKIWIRNNIVYDVKDGSTVLGLISKDDIYFVLDIPDDFKIDAAMIAQDGQIIRHSYGYWWLCSSYSNAMRNSLSIYGSIMSKEKSYWNYGSYSGFYTRTVNYDSNLFYLPPPYFPTTGEYEFISWEEL
ncbi:MAG: hypothetical protein COT91_04690 [Candidatus Doudnabacteria bacterium CG10_big_fil_rev_8_21_14_0_10_41_10]|uniref:DUF4900 domain-containing protein n=1 Tax=Candidatus Doudnabacteria bacterium CG10_big_fil_rev_8_21_14_0_10_41_10 TaxID=1974551 RepID=A0A2H0VCM2_9BACT|nr:MAG: hypothetical protein COT91_04690 [Candidatus Doudnabacteria bacterium CG10_big_fil_rev_8_21_14_0_10_41_10]